jgi:hypothetical protein
MIIAGVVLLVVAAVAVGIALAGRRRWQVMVGAPTSTSGDLRLHLETAAGLGATGGGFARPCELVGSAGPGPHGELRSELSGAPCVWYRYEVRRRYWDTERDSDGRRRRVQRTETVTELASAAAFTLADDAGTVLVDPTGGSVDKAERVLDRFEPDESGDTIGYEKEEWILRAGTRLYVLGEATDRSGDLAVGKPDKGLFIISTRSEAELTAGARRRQQIGMAVGAVALVAALVFLALGALI